MDKNAISAGLAALMLICCACSVVMAQEKALVIACRKTTWATVANGKKAKIRQAIAKVAGCNEDGVPDVPVVWTNSSGVEWYVIAASMYHLRSDGGISATKIQQWKDALSDVNIKVTLTDDADSDLRAAGLKPKDSSL